MRPKSATIGRAHRLPKTHKQFDSISKFRPNTNTPYYGVGKFLSQLLNPLTRNEFTFNDTF